MHNCTRCKVESIGGHNFTTEPHSLDCPNANSRGHSLIRDAKNGSGPLSVLSFCDLADLVAVYSPYGKDARDRFFAALRERAERMVP